MGKEEKKRNFSFLDDEHVLLIESTNRVHVNGYEMDSGYVCVHV